jgi:hypothetical protein
MSSYIDTPPQVRRWGCIHPGHYWGAHTFDRLAWAYGDRRAQQIRAGQDNQTNIDIAAWRNLGESA